MFGCVYLFACVLARSILLCPSICLLPVLGGLVMGCRGSRRRVVSRSPAGHRAPPNLISADLQALSAGHRSSACSTTFQRVLMLSSHV